MISPVTRSKAEAKRSYNRLSRWYDLLSGSSEAKYRRLGLELLNTQPEEAVLEIGFGTGQALLTLARAVGKTGQVAGLDLSDGMLAAAQARLRSAGLAGRVHLQVGDGAQLPFEAEAFDAVFMSFTLELFDTPEIPIILSQCRTVLRPGGRICIVSLVKSPHPGWPERTYEWFHARLPGVVDCRPILAQASLGEAGFSIWKVISQFMWGLPIEVILAGKG